MKATFFGGQTHGYLYLNEALSASIGHRIGVNVPRCAVLELTPEQLDTLSPGRPVTERFVFASEFIANAEPLSPEATGAARTEDMAGIAVFDALIWNTDRKEEHVLSVQQDGEWRLWAIDHGHTFAVANSLMGALGPDAPAAIPVSLMRDRLTRAALDPWIHRAANIDRSEFVRMVASVPGQWVVEPDAPEVLADALVR
jgi:hypothetical protein